MTTEITIETVKERIAALEGAGELSLKERVYLWAMRRLVAIDIQSKVDEIDFVAATLEHIGRFADAAQLRQLSAKLQQNAPQNIPEIIPDTCTCPSGDGSLRWPCPVHPGNSPVSPDTCAWTFSAYDSHWSGTCGIEWIFTDGGPEENGVKFCPKCGKSVAIETTEGTEE